MKLVWDKAGERFYETGVSKGVLFVMSDDPLTPGVYGNGVVWNGLINVTHSPTGAEATPFYADNKKYLNLMSNEELEASIEAFTYPDAWAECDGSASPTAGVKVGQQKRKQFALCYQTKIGNDLNPDLGYKIHIIYGCLAGPSEKSHDTVNDTPEAMTFSWDITTTPVELEGYQPVSSLEIDSTKVPESRLAELETILYGTELLAARLPLPAEVITIIETVA
jgi:hypothetical protein